MTTEQMERGIFGKMIDFIVWLMVIACRVMSATKGDKDGREEE